MEGGGRGIISRIRASARKVSRGRNRFSIYRLDGVLISRRCSWFIHAARRDRRFRYYRGLHLPASREFRVSVRGGLSRLSRKSEMSDACANRDGDVAEGRFDRICRFNDCVSCRCDSPAHHSVPAKRSGRLRFRVTADLVLSSTRRNGGETPKTRSTL